MTHISESNNVGVVSVAIENLNFLLTVPRLLGDDLDGVLLPGGLVDAAAAHTVAAAAHLLGQVILVVYAVWLHPRQSLESDGGVRQSNVWCRLLVMDVLTNNLKSVCHCKHVSGGVCVCCLTHPASPLLWDSLHTGLLLFPTKYIPQGFTDVNKLGAQSASPPLASATYGCLF